jgi:hypothetical protein
MLKIDYSKNFKRNDYYIKLSTKSINVYLCKKDKDKKCIKENNKIIQIIRDEFKNIDDFKEKKTVTLVEVFNKFKEVKKDNFHIVFKDISFKCLLIGNFKILQKIKKQIGTKKENKSINFLFNYTELRKDYISPFFENNLNISTCYYCNIDYVNSYNTDKKKKNKFTLDHYYDKSTYPYLGLSLYNFVPSCYACNSKLKGRKEFSNLSPSSKSFDFNQKVKFKLFMTESCTDLNIKKKENIDIKLKENYSNEYEKYIEVFKLNERYQAHKDIIFEMIKNVELYPESRLKELQELTGIPYQEIKKDIFNLIEDDADLSKEPFSKLKRDMAKELGLLK